MQPLANREPIRLIPMTQFSDFNLPPALATALANMNYVTPTPIQAQSIPHVLEGRDLLATAMTGSGKTAAFSVPMISRMLTNSRGTALILVPTRELAQQVEKVVKEMLGIYSTIKSALLIGGDSMPLQIQALRARPRIIVGTPGRVIDHLERGNLMLHDTSYLVLDEMDRMLDMGFEDQIMKILKFLPMQRQTLLFSATLPPQIIKISEKYLKSPVRITVGEVNKAADKIVQTTRNVHPDDKYGALLDELKARDGTVIIFVRSKMGTEKLASKLKKNGYTADAIHGDLEQRQRERVLQDFRDKKHRILVATDIASRGLDIPHIEHVVNYDLPMAPEDYIHRIGRTARAGAEGAAVSFITPEDRLKWHAIQRLINPDYKPEQMTNEPRSSTAPQSDKPAREGGDKKRRSRGGRDRKRSDKPREQAAATSTQAAPAAPSNVVPMQQPAAQPAAAAAPHHTDHTHSGGNGGNVKASGIANSSAPIPGLPPAI